jgi:CheY-like chemotaxis protein
MFSGHSVEEAEDGRKCLEKVKKSMAAGTGTGGGYDVILCDDHMPGISGPEAVKVGGDGAALCVTVTVIYSA